MQKCAMHVFEAAIRSYYCQASTTLVSPGHPWRSEPRWEEGNMNTARKVAIALVTATLSVGLLGISAPAHADVSWTASFRR